MSCHRLALENWASSSGREGCWLQPIGSNSDWRSNWQESLSHFWFGMTCHYTAHVHALNPTGVPNLRHCTQAPPPTPQHVWNMHEISAFVRFKGVVFENGTMSLPTFSAVCFCFVLFFFYCRSSLLHYRIPLSVVPLNLKCNLHLKISRLAVANYSHTGCHITFQYGLHICIHRFGQ